MSIDEMHKLLKTGFANGSEMSRIADKLRSQEARLQAAEELAADIELQRQGTIRIAEIYQSAARFRAAGKGE